MEEKPSGTPNPLNPEIRDFSEPEIKPEVNVNNDFMNQNFGSASESPKDGITSSDFEPKAPRVEPNLPRGPKAFDMVRPINSAPNSPVSSNPPLNYFTPNHPLDSRHPINSFEPSSDYEQPTQPLGIVTSLDGTPERISTPTNTNPMYRPMQKAVNENQAQAGKKKPKPGFIIGMICSIFVAIGCAVAAILFFVNTNKEDVVSVAIEKLMSAEAPENIKAEGAIDINYKDPSSPIASMNIRINSEIVTKFMINSSNASLNAKLRNGKSFSVDFEEIYAANGDLYIRTSGLVDALANISTVTQAEPTEPTTPIESTNITEETEVQGIVVGGESTETTNCQEETCPTTPNPDDTLIALETVFDAFDTADGQWLRIPLNNLNLDESEDVSISTSLTCFANLINDVRGNEFKERYQKDSFITSTTEDLHASNKANPLYKVLINGQSFRDFVGEMNRPQFIFDLAACWGYDKTEINADRLLSDLQTLPEMYVEVNDSHDFTRFYFITNLTQENATLSVDLDFTYPENVNVPEPAEYKDISEVTQNLSESLREANKTE